MHIYSRKGENMKVQYKLLYGGAILSCLLAGQLHAQNVNSSTGNVSPGPLKSGKGQQVRMTSGQSGELPSYSATGAPAANYQIAPNDVLDIRIFREPDLSTTARVSNDGFVNLPLIGQIKIGGMSVDQAAKFIQSRLAAGFLPNPQVTVNVTEFNHRRFTVLGQVTRSGTYEFPDEGPLDLLQAIGLAGGYTSIADPGHVLIKRQTNGKTNIYQVNAKKMANGRADYEVSVMPGDIITVGESLF
jgi:polysaccharide export outer membrane protein